MKKLKFIYGKYKYEYNLILEKRKTFSLSVYPDMKIVLRAPNKMDSNEIEKFLKKKWLWLERQLQFFAQFQGKRVQRDYISGESFLYLGRQYKLIVEKSKDDYVSLQKGRLIIYTKGNLRDSARNKKLLDKWYRDKIEKVFNERLDEIVKKFDYNFDFKLVVRKMNKRWGSYAKNQTISLNPSLINASKKCIDYVITHELCHVKYHSHNKNFLRLLNRKFPNWEKVKEELELRFI
ncbi:MAG: hypothetical protein ACD_7C00154G0004 [uncultured bacterium]|nr:MAG: hypothetical protein ACD_7C00154G0004 [uncultured bacterium]KKP68208.1 MAG: hypothetical protein UR66_C0007G0015 [Candidatus Moranbacteria bacterium GW2011_GWE1_35_17]KKP82231.1 MAG: hypothetical protein UR83_C0055G0015 [Candidatus Moranbacteria bacterium GW2011_GWF2_35_54]KKP83285.1 MAG: hypothetical protein UR82_C0023G0014 [Candidatus Moranbacteria bacterium GW2011_GWF1_35_5]HBR79363.1 M48 family peptidase [Candidatus Moranbacteria bacterium]